MACGLCLTHIITGRAQLCSGRKRSAFSHFWNLQVSPIPTFTLVTDHKLLTTILSPKKGIPALSAARMQRWALLLSAYTYDIRFHPTQAHGNADGLSHLPVREDQSCTPDIAMVFNIAQLDALPVCSSELMAATHTDPQLSKILQYVRKGWPEKISNTLCPFWQRRSELTGGRFDIVGCSCGDSN